MRPATLHGIILHKIHRGSYCLVQALLVQTPGRMGLASTHTTVGTAPCQGQPANSMDGTAHYADARDWYPMPHTEIPQKMIFWFSVQNCAWTFTLSNFFPLTEKIGSLQLCLREESCVTLQCPFQSGSINCPLI